MRTLLLLVICACNVASPNYIPPTTLTVHPALAHPAPDGAVYDGALWAIGAHRGLLTYPLPVLPGDQITAWTLTLQRDTTGPLGPTTAAYLGRLARGGLAHEQIDMTASDTREVTGEVTLTIRLDPVYDVPADGAGYALLVGGDGVTGDRAGMVSVEVLRQ